MKCDFISHQILNTDFVNSDEKSVLSDKQSHEHDSDDFAAMPR